jgi:LDH2 family malate/lactate/ureidoglycolate dehydrogenase
MVYYPNTEKELRIDASNLKTFVKSIFLACNMNNEDASVVTESLIHADLRGIHSHGVIRVPDYVKKLQVDGVDPSGNPFVLKEFGGTSRVNGNNSMGQIGAKFSMLHAINKAKKFGISYVSLEGSNHCGALDWYSLMASEAKCVGIVGTNALPTMAPWGGMDKIVGINPISISFPGINCDDLVIDASLGQTSHGKIRIYAQKKEKIPEGWAFDKDGLPTSDPEKALEGLIQPIGGFKGIGLAMMVGMLSTMLSDAKYGSNSGNMIDGAISGVDGQFFIVINIGELIDLDTYQTKINEMIREFKSSRSLKNNNIYLPGEIENQLKIHNAKFGIPLNNETISNLNDVIDNLQLNISLNDLLK